MPIGIGFERNVRGAAELREAHSNVDNGRSATATEQAQADIFAGLKIKHQMLLVDLYGCVREPGRVGEPRVVLQSPTYMTAARAGMGGIVIFHQRAWFGLLMDFLLVRRASVLHGCGEDEIRSARLQR